MFYNKEEGGEKRSESSHFDYAKKLRQDKKHSEKQVIKNKLIGRKESPLLQRSFWHSLKLAKFKLHWN